MLDTLSWSLVHVCQWLHYSGSESTKDLYAQGTALCSTPLIVTELNFSETETLRKKSCRLWTLSNPQKQTAENTLLPAQAPQSCCVGTGRDRWLWIIIRREVTASNMADTRRWGRGGGWRHTASRKQTIAESLSLSQDSPSENQHMVSKQLISHMNFICGHMKQQFTHFHWHVWDGSVILGSQSLV